MIWGKWWIGKKKKNPFPSFYPLDPNSFLVGQPVGHRLPVTFPTFIRFLASNVREETWSTSIVRNERDFLRWNGWSSHGTMRSSKQWSLSWCPPDGKGNPRFEKSIQLSKFLLYPVLSYPVSIDFFNMNIFVIWSRTFSWIRLDLSKTICSLIYKKIK